MATRKELRDKVSHKARVATQSALYLPASGRGFTREMMKMLNLILIVVMGFALGGCATSEKVQVTQMGDSQMTCTNLGDELIKMDKAQADIDSKKGVTGTNVASASLFIPGLAYTYYDAGEATKAVGDSRSKLIEIYERKKCSANVAEKAKETESVAQQTVEPPQPTAPAKAPTPTPVTGAKKKTKTKSSGL